MFAVSLRATDKSGLEKLRFLRTQGIYQSLGRTALLAETEGTAILRQEAPKRTGHFASTIRALKVWRDLDRVKVEYEAQQPLALFIIGGTRPHVIFPRERQVLRFEVGGQVVFARKVNHPGTKPNDFRRRAMARMRDSLFTGFAGNVRAAFAGTAGGP